jgi:hypothetical protein
VFNRFGVLAYLLLSACASHHYYYLPEVSGPGAMAGRKGGVIYSIPARGNPELKLHLRTLGVRKVKDAQMLALRLSFTRPDGQTAAPGKSREYIRPSELIVKIGDKLQLQPAYIHTMARQKDLIELTGRPREVVELLFPLPKGSQGEKDVESYYFQWKVHYGYDATESQTARFDRNDSVPQQSAEYDAEDPDYPYDIAPMGMAGWQVNQDPFWWWMDPWSPWW